VATSLTVLADAALRLTPEMTSSRLLVLAFVRDYLTSYGGSPSYGEIANALRISPTRARQLVKALVTSGQLLRRPGPRGLSLPTLRDEAVRQLRDLGWAIDEDREVVIAPCAHSPLPALPMLDYVPPELAEVQGGDDREDPRSEAAREGNGSNWRDQQARLG
jgi:hypothetical protein